jgi:hypothetical protein
MFVTKVWLIAFPLIKQEVDRKSIAAVDGVAVTDISVAVAAKPAFILYEYVQAEKPARADLSRFVLLYDTTAKKSLTFDEINSSAFSKISGQIAFALGTRTCT